MTMSDFDARAATWDDDPAKVERAQAVADAIVRSVPAYQRDARTWSTAAAPGC